ncbi:MAG: hypothetical protein JJE03_07110 [Peptostreptococcaceae bacterium]|nr:hypothetical protein [Peptostreptococcaceae bacterium]
MENLSDLITWKDLLTSNPNANVYKVSFESTPVKLDANLLRGIPIDPPDIKVATINSFNCLYQYWTGTPSDNPVWELLLPLPVKVIEKVDNSVISNLFI